MPDRTPSSSDRTSRPAGTTRASDDLGAVPGPGVDKHDAEPGFHGHAPYPSEADLEQRLASARGAVAPTVEEPLPVPDPAQQ